MKAVLTLLVGLCLSTTALFAQGYKPQEKNVVVFIRSMNATSLAMLKEDLATKGITVSYDDVKYGEGDQLESIHFTVKDGTGRSYSAGTDKVLRKVPFGFEFKVVDGVPTILTVGSLEGN